VDRGRLDLGGGELRQPVAGFGSFLPESDAGGLGVGVQEQNLPAVGGEQRRQVGAEGALADSSLLVGDGDDFQNPSYG